MDESRQQKIDFARGEQLGAIRNCVLPALKTADGKTVSGRSMKAVLVAIDSRAGKAGTCYASIDRIALDAGVNRKTALRALDGLRQLRLLIEQRDEADRRLIHRRIAFTNLADFDAASQAEIRDTGGAIGDTGATDQMFEIRDTGGAIRDTVSRIRDTGNPQRDMKRPERELHGGGGNGVSKKDGDGEKPRSQPPPADRGFCLRDQIQTDDLVNPDIVAELWVAVLEHQLLPETEYWRETFWGLCFSIWRNRARLINPVGLLHQKLASGRQAVLAQVTDADDRPWARRHLRRARDRPLAALPVDPEAVRVREFEQRRSEQLRALYEMQRGVK